MFKVGDEVFSRKFGSGVITAREDRVFPSVLGTGYHYPWCVVFDESKDLNRWFTDEGKYVYTGPEDDPLNIKLRYPREIEDTRHDYSFNKSIADALKDGEKVWCKCNCGDKDCSKWGEVDGDNSIKISSVFEYSWSLVKPTTKVKKKLTLYVNMCKDIVESYSYEKEAAIHNATCSTTATAVELTGEYTREE